MSEFREVGAVVRISDQKCLVCAGLGAPYVFDVQDGIARGVIVTVCSVLENRTWVTTMEPGDSSLPVVKDVRIDTRFCDLMEELDEPLDQERLSYLFNIYSKGWLDGKKVTP